MCSHSSMEWLRVVLLFALHHQEKYSNRSRSPLMVWNVIKVSLPASP